MVGPLKNFTDYDFLEIQNHKKKVTDNLTAEPVVVQSKRRTIVGGKGKGFDPAQVFIFFFFFIFGFFLKTKCLSV